MANDFGALTDHFSLVSDDLVLIDSDSKPFPKKFAPAPDETNDLAGGTYYGYGTGLSTVMCKYRLKSGTLNLNTLSIGEIETGVAIGDITAETDAGACPVLTVNGILGASAFTVPTGKTANAALPSLSLIGAKFAQVLEFTVGAGCKLSKSSVSFKCNIVQEDDGLGEPCSWSVEFNERPTVSASFVRISAKPSWTPSANLTETQPPTTVEPSAAHHTSDAEGDLAALVRGTAA